jgi:flagellar hook-associated protein 3 FlgL
MTTRITTGTLVNNSLYYLGQQSATLATLTDQASSGNRILKPSDDPFGTVTVLAADSQNQRLGAYLSDINSATNTLNTSVSALTQVSNDLTQASTIATEAANSSNDSTAFESLAQEVDGLINQVISLANTKENGQYLFAGTATASAPFSVATTDAQGRPLTVAYSGSTQRGQVITGEGQTVDTTYDGAQVFQSSGQDVFQALVTLRDTLRNTAGLTTNQQVAALSQQIGTIASARQGVLSATGEQSVSLQSLGALQSRVQSLQTTAQQRASSVRSADLPTVLVNLQAQENAYQVSLAVAGRIFDQNLLTFLPPQSL